MGFTASGPSAPLGDVGAREFCICITGTAGFGSNMVCFDNANGIQIVDLEESFRMYHSSNLFMCTLLSSGWADGRAGGRPADGRVGAPYRHTYIYIYSLCAVIGFTCFFKGSE